MASKSRSIGSPLGWLRLSTENGATPRKNHERDTILGKSADLPFDDLNGFQDLMRRVREGSEDAAWEVVRRYGGYIRRAVRRVLNPKLRYKFDSLDFVQWVWLSFFRMHDKAERFERPQFLVTFLAGMARNKVQMEVPSPVGNGAV